MSIRAFTFDTTKEWLKARKEGIGGSDVSALMEHPLSYKSYHRFTTR